ncbi:helix-turn-helix domain-containing protein [Clostridium arbusti]|uniref:helix-turn-helix domain-containing protein n=1 Tax=Clostridium arbusti TaxID=1137848 RepID=UPI00028827C9|nr:helix-turn-helix domain-containing protein [Clostridium arbusti]
MNEIRYKISESHKGHHCSEEAKKKISEAKKYYNTSEEIRKKLRESHANFSGANHPQARKIICSTTGEIFGYINQAVKKYGIPQSSISKCCKGKYKTAGRLPNRTKMVWMYYDEYLEKYKKAI